MTAQRIQIGQVWKKVDSGETFLVTKLYNEALSTIAGLRPTGAATESMIRVRAHRQGDTQRLPGYSMAQENEGSEGACPILIPTPPAAQQRPPPASLPSLKRARRIPLPPIVRSSVRS